MSLRLAGLSKGWQGSPDGGPGPDRSAAVTRLVFDLTFVFIAFDNLPRLLTGMPWPPVFLVSLAAWRLVCGSVLKLYWRPLSSLRAAGFWLAGELAFALGASELAAHIASGPKPLHVWAGVGVHAGLLLAAMAIRKAGKQSPGSPAREDLRWGLLLLLALVLAHPWFSPLLVGTGDAKLYAETLQDFLAQLHAGVVPPLVSQSEIAPFGAVFPFRLATYHYYFAALVDTLTFGQLTVYAVQHLTVILSFVGGGWAMYAVLRRLSPSHPWVSCAMAALYLSSPAWLGPLYAMTMFFTVMTLPFVPLALAGAWSEFGATSWSRAVVHGIALAATWHAHPAVGFFVFAIVAAGQLVGLCLKPSTWRLLGRQATSWAVCGLLCCGLWYSAASLHAVGTSGGDMSVMIVNIVNSAFPMSILPAQWSPGGLGDLQLGYSLAIALLLGATSFALGQRKALIWLLPAILIMVLTLPFPYVTGWLWHRVPAMAQRIAGPWPVQRLLPPLAGLAALSGALAFSHLAAISQRWQRGLTGLLAAMLLWSGFEAVKYLRHGYQTVLPRELSARMTRVENSSLLLNWLAFLPNRVPAVFEPGTIRDTWLYNRVWSGDKTRLIADNGAAALARASSAPFVSATATPLVTDVWRLLPYIEFESGRHYLLELKPTDRTVKGTFVLSALDYQRTYSDLLPGGQGTVLQLSSSASNAQPMELVFLTPGTGLPLQPIPNFLTYRLIPYDPSDLPVRRKGFIPYQSAVDLTEPGWLETSRIFVEGYQATVNGHPAPVTMSADGRAMIPVPAGSSFIGLEYTGTPRLRIGYAVMAAAWFLLFVWGTRRLATRLGTAAVVE